MPAISAQQRTTMCATSSAAVRLAQTQVTVTQPVRAPLGPQISLAPVLLQRSCRFQRDDGAGTEGTGGKAGTYDGIVRVRGLKQISLSIVITGFMCPVATVSFERPQCSLHWVASASTCIGLAEFTELNRLADQEDIIVVYGHPEWRDFGSYDVFSWYSYKEAYEVTWADNPDIAYMGASHYPGALRAL